MEKEKQDSLGKKIGKLIEQENRERGGIRRLSKRSIKVRIN